MSVTDIYRKMPTWQQIIAAWRPTNCVLHIYSKTPLPLTIWFFITPKYGDFLEQKQRRGWISSKIVCKDSTFCIKVLRIKKTKVCTEGKGKVAWFLYESRHITVRNRHLWSPKQAYSEPKGTCFVPQSTPFRHKKATFRGLKGSFSPFNSNRTRL